MGKVPLGLALSGGIARCVAHIGVIKAFEDHGLKIDFLSGTSGGSIVAVLYAAGKSGDELAELAGSMSWLKLAGLTLPKDGFLSSDKIGEFIVDQLGDLEFDDLKIPTVVIASDLTSGSGRIFSGGRVALACQASSSIPQIYRPVEIDGHSLVDGGLVEQLPVRALSSFGPMFRIGVNLAMVGESRRKPRHMVEGVLQLINFMFQQNVAKSLAAADYVIAPDVGGFNPFALHRATELIETGYEEAVRRLPAIEEALRSRGSIRGKLKQIMRLRHK